jgi:hypothetical protein
MIIDNTKFLKLANQFKIDCALKSYSDTLLFYYLGYLASKNTGDISEIGVGGSTYALIELADQMNKTFFVFDNDIERVERIKTYSQWPEAKLTIMIEDSEKLPSYAGIPKFAYSHLDGSKHFNIAMSDLEFYLDHLAVNGLICQDDYGNNKWPTITDAIKQLEHNNKIKIIMIGDSSIWITAPEYYEYWMEILHNDYEFSLLSALCNVVNSRVLNKLPEYFLMQPILCETKLTSRMYLLDNYTKEEQDYFNNLLELDLIQYLQMPYRDQSAVGTALGISYIYGYMLTNLYNIFRGRDWPEKVPVTIQDIGALPDQIKDELRDIFAVDIFQPALVRNLTIKSEL